MAWCRQATSLYDTKPVPEPMLNQIYVAIDVCMSRQASVSQNLDELIQWWTYFFTSQLCAVIARSIRMQYYRLSIYRGWIWYDNQHNTEVKKMKLYLDYKLRKDTSHLALTSELWSVLTEFFGENIPRDIESAVLDTALQCLSQEK